MANLEYLDRTFRILPVQLVDDLEQTPNLGRGFGDDERVLLLHRGHRSIGGHHHREFFRQGFGQCNVQRFDHGDNLVRRHLAGQFTDKGRDVLPLHFRKFLEVQHVIIDPEHDPLGLQDDVEHPQRIGQLVRLRRQVIELALGNIRLADDGQSGGAGKEIEHLIEAGPLEVKTDNAG